MQVALDPIKEYGRGTFLFSSASKEARVAALHGLFQDPHVDLVMSVRGGYGSLELLPLIDFELLSRHSKPLLGISDVTALLVAAYQRAGIPAIHAPALAGGLSRVRSDPDDCTSFTALRGLLAGSIVNPFEGRRFTPVSGPSAGEGRLIGGNLSLLVSMLGTPWEPDFSGHILCIEETGEKPYRIHRMLLQLKLAGKFNGVGGIVFGAMDSVRAGESRPQSGPTVAAVLSDIFRDPPFPVVRDAPFGHQALNLPIPFGVPARINGHALELLPSTVLA